MYLAAVQQERNMIKPRCSSEVSAATTACKVIDASLNRLALPLVEQQDRPVGYSEISNRQVTL